jgi:GxxExxY protein
MIAHAELGAGLLESIYTPCLVMELQAARLDVERGRHIPIIYKGRPILQPDLVADLVVEGTVLVEVKAVESIARVHKAQVITYLKLTGLPVGLLMNFNVPVLYEGVHRLVHPKLYERPTRPNRPDPVA